MAKAVRVLGTILLYCGIGLIVVGYGFILYSDGFWKLIEIMSPLNIWNWIAVVATLLPSILLIQLADKLKQKELERQITKFSEGSDLQ